jgi:quercetin dioxygenase-like cupin family protein
MHFRWSPDKGARREALDILGEEVLVKLTNTDTNGAAAVFHLTVPPMSGPPLHRHSREDEWFYVLDGEITAEIDGQKTVAIEDDREALDVFGPSVQFLVAPQPSDEAPCVVKGTIPPGVSVPIDSHPGIEAFFVLSGNVEVLSDEGGKAHWIAAGPGDFIEVPGNAKHAFRNSSRHPVVQLITTTSKLGRFFQEGRSDNSARKCESTVFR